MHYNVVVFGDNVKERLLPFYDQFIVCETALCVNDYCAFYDSLELLRTDYPHITDSQISFEVPNKEWDSWKIGGRYSGALKVLDDEDGYIFNESKHGCLDQTCVGNLDLSEQGFIPDAYLLKGVWTDTPVRFWNEEEYKNPILKADQWCVWKDVLLSLPKDTLITLVDWHK